MWSGCGAASGLRRFLPVREVIQNCDTTNSQYTDLRVSYWQGKRNIMSMRKQILLPFFLDRGLDYFYNKTNDLKHMF